MPAVFVKLYAPKLHFSTNPLPLSGQSALDWFVSPSLQSIEVIYPLGEDSDVIEVTIVKQTGESQSYRYRGDYLVELCPIS